MHPRKTQILENGVFFVFEKVAANPLSAKYENHNETINLGWIRLKKTYVIGKLSYLKPLFSTEKIIHDNIVHKKSKYLSDMLRKQTLWF